MSDDQQAAELWRAALEEHVRGMSDNEFQQLLARTRPPEYSRFTDPAERIRAHSAAIAAKQQAAKQQRAQPPPQPSQADLEALRAQIKAAQDRGDFALAIALKQRLRPPTDANGYVIKKGTAQ